MHSETSKIKDVCSDDAIFAYLDGELSPQEELDLEFHFAECKKCADEVNAQKKVSNSLEIILEDEMKNIELPENFTKVVTAKAESDVSGLRQGREIRRALWISGGLLLLVTLGLGTKVKVFWTTAGSFVDKIYAVAAFAGHLVYDTAIGVTVILRSLSHKFVFGSFISLVLVVAFFIVAFLSLSRLILRHNRS